MSDLKDFIVPIRRHIHANPEIGFGTFQTASYIKGILQELGYRIQPVLEGAGLLAYLDLGKEKTIAFRSDMDALPLKELTSLPFKSDNGNMHACGHDGHMSMLLGAAKLFQEHKKELNVNIILIFQPAEEMPLPGGAIKIIETGLLDKVSMFFAFHVTNKLRTGECGIKKGPACAAPDLWEGVIHGKGCHASAPQNGINPIIPATYIVQRFLALGEEVKKEDPNTVITTAYIQSGVSMNVIVDDAFIKGTARSFSQERRDFLKKNLTEIATKTAAEFGATADFTFHYAYDPLINDEQAFLKASEAEKEVLGNGFRFLEKPEMIGEDFAYYRRIAPICLTWLGVRGKDQDFYDLHSPRFLLDEDALVYGSLIDLQIALSF